MVALLVVLVPPTVLCQYQVSPEGGVPRVKAVLPQLVLTVGTGGVPGALFTL